MKLFTTVVIAIAVGALVGCHKPVNEAAANTTQAATGNEADIGEADQAADNNLSDSSNQAEAAEGEVRQ